MPRCLGCLALYSVPTVRVGCTSSVERITDAYQFRPGNLRHQRESTTGAAGGGGRGTNDDCAADGCALGCGGLGCGIGAACWDGDRGVDDIFCLMSSSTACSVAMFWAI